LSGRGNSASHLQGGARFFEEKVSVPASGARREKIVGKKGEHGEVVL